MLVTLPEQTDPPVVWDLLAAQRGHRAFDIGANTGQAARVLAPHFNQVVSVEPCAEAYDVLWQQVPDNVFVLDAAVSDHTGKVTLDETANSIRSGQLTTGVGLNWGDVVGQREVTSYTLDSLAGIYGSPDFVKIDTEGHELAVVLGGRETFAHGPAVLIEVHRAGNEEPLRAALAGYELRKIEHPYLVGNPMGVHHFWLEGRP